MEIIDVEKSESFYYLDQIRLLYAASFPSAQFRPIEIITKMLDLDPNYHLFGVRIHNSIVGFSFLYTFISSILSSPRLLGDRQKVRVRNRK